MIELSRLSGCRGVSCWTVIFISFYAINERTLASDARNPNNYPLINTSWCLDDDFAKYCLFEMRSIEFSKMLLDFCRDQYYGFIGLKDLGINEEEADYLGPKEYTSEQIDRIVEAVTDAWAQNDETKKAFLKNPLFYCPDRDENQCYWKVYKVFALFCLDPFYNMHARHYKNIFVHICEADWLDLRTIASLTKSTCIKKKDIMNGGVPVTSSLA